MGNTTLISGKKTRFVGTIIPAPSLLLLFTTKNQVL